MTTTRITKILILATIAILVIWDLIAWASPVQCNTISCVILGWARLHPTITFAAGVLIGHLFFPQTIKITGDKEELMD